MILMYELDLNILQMYLRNKNELSTPQLISIAYRHANRQTDRQTGATNHYRSRIRGS